MKNIIKLLKFLEVMNEEKFNKIYKVYWAAVVVGGLFSSGFLINAIAHLLGK